jgi:hypothetical protein
VHPVLTCAPCTEDGVDLFIWGNAESSVTIIAASIPILRVLVREARTSARRYYMTKEGASSATRSRNGRSQHNTVVISTGTGGVSRTVISKPKLDNSSDKSILSDPPANGKIMRTNEINVAYQSRLDNDSEEFELQNV